MKRLFLMAFLLLFPFIVYQGCSSNNSPTGPTGPVPTNTFTVNATLGTATHTPTITATLNPTLGTATFTFTANLSTGTPTATETPLCGSPYSFGRNFVGGTNSAFSSGNLFACRYALPAAGKVTMLHVYCPNTVGSNIRMALYSNSGSAPGTLISQSNPQVSVGFWNNANIPDTGTLAAGTYWIAIVFDGTSLGLSYDTGSAGDTQYQSLSFGPCPTSFTGGSSSTWDFSFYADYCVGAGSPTPVPTITWTFTPTFTPSFTQTFTQTPLPACSGNYSAGTNFPLGSTGVFNNYGSIFCSPITMTVTGRVTLLHYYSGGAGNNVQMALYSNNSSAPQSLITKSSSQAAVSGINNVDVPDTGELAPGVYWVVARPDSSSNLNFYYDYPGSGGYWMNDGSGDFPAVSTGGSAPGYLFSFWADYCVDSGSPTPALTPTWTTTPSFTPTFTPTFTQTPLPSCLGNYSAGANYLVGSTGSGFNNTGYLFCSSIVLPVTGRVTELHFIASAAGSNVQMALYTNSAGAPHSLITLSSSQAAVSGINNVAVPTTGELAPGTYWIALSTDSTVNLYDNYTGGSDGYWAYGGPGSFPATSSGGIVPGYLFSFYADYCVDSGSPTPALTATWSPTPSFTPTLTSTVTETPLCTGGAVTLGKTTIGASGGFSGGNLLATRYVLSSTGKKVTLLNFYVASMPTPVATYDVRMGLYANSGSAPGTLITQSSNYNPHLGWNIVNIPDTPTLSAPATYWIALIHDNYAYSLDIRYDSTGLYDGYYAGSSFGPLPATFPAGSAQDWTFSFYGTTCP